MSTPPRDGRPVSLDTKLKKHATQFKVYAVSPFHLRSILDQNERRGGRRPMSLLITCEVGGDTIPPWLIPQLHSLNIPKRNRQRKVTRKNAGKAKRRRQTTSSANAKNSRTHLGDGLQLESGDDSLSAQSLATGIKPNLLGPQTTSQPAFAGEILEQIEVDRCGLEIANLIATQLDVPSYFNRYPIELVDVTKNPNQRRLFTGPFRGINRIAQQRLLEEIHTTYFDGLVKEVESSIKSDGFVIHLSVKTFPLKHNGNRRRTDVGLLYDSSCEDEADLCMDWYEDLWYRAPMLKVRRNYPRRGSEVGVTRRLRKRFNRSNYVGVELWLNRAWAGRNVSLRQEALSAMIESLGSVSGVEEHPLPADIYYDEAA